MSEPKTKSQVDSASPEASKPGNVLELPFDQYQRYQLIQESIESIRWNPRLNVLDLSKAPRMLDRFLPNDNVVFADITDQDGSECFPNGKALAFDDAAFDLVVTSEVLPHVVAERHQKVLSLTEHVAERQNAVESLSAQLTERDERLRVLTESLTEQERVIDMLRDELRKK